MRIGVGSRGGDFFSFGRALVETFESQKADLSVEIVSIEGAISSLESLQRGTSDCGFSYANVAYEAFAGKLRDEPGPLKHLRGVALVQVSPLYFLVRQQSSIKSIPDLRGRSVGIGVKGSASSHAGLLLLDAFGLDVRSVRLNTDGFGTSFRQFLRGSSPDSIIAVGGQPSNFIARAVTEGARVLPLEGPVVDALRARYPFLRPSSIPAGSYPGQLRAIRTVGVESMLLCRDEISAADVQLATQNWFLTFDRLVKNDLLADGVSPRMASATPIPLHTGASNYYRARQVLLR